MTVTDDSDRQAEAGEWLSVTDAMTRLRVSERTLRRHLASGRLDKRRRLGGRLEVWVPGNGDRQASSANDRRGADNDRIERSIALVERFNLAVHDQVVPILNQLDAAHQRIADLSRANGRLEAELVEARRRLSERDAPPAPAPVDEHGVNDDIAGAPSTEKRPWWAFWRG
jgi:hypothetical protein